MIDLNMPVTGSMKLFGDNKSTISVVHNPVQRDRMKYMRIDRDFIKSEIKNGTIALSYIPTKSQEANVLTKVLHKSNFNIYIYKLGMTHIYFSG